MLADWLLTRRRAGWPAAQYDDMSHADVERDPRFAPFLDFHAYLATTYPLVHATARLDKINRLSLVYTFAGSSPDLKPSLLAAHQDVVPAQTSLDRWTYPPFEGVFDGKIVWGRGAPFFNSCSLVGLLRLTPRAGGCQAPPTARTR
jgi:Gly-Xaa carboxypeptidase